MHRVAAGRRRRSDHVRDPQIAVGCGGRTDAHAAVGETHVQAIGVRGRVDRHGFDAGFVRRANHPHGDLSAVGDEDA